MVTFGKQMVAKNPVEQMKALREKRIKEAEKAAKVAALTDREIAKRRRAKERRDQIRTERLERERREIEQLQREHRAAREAEVQAVKAKQQAVLKEAGVLVEQQQINTTSPPSPSVRALKRVRPKGPPSNASPNSVVRELSPSVTGPVAPSLCELRNDESYHANPMPMTDEATVTSLATMRVLYADAEHGMGLWGEESNRWARPDGWWPVIEKLNSAFTYYGQRDSNIVMGEYNAVFIDCVEKYCDWLPTFVDPNGNTLDLGDLVFRITRPDVEHTGQKDAPCRHRYKTLREQADELYYSLHGAANGYAIPCVAAIIFTGPKVRRKGKFLQLYGSLYVLRKAPVTLNNVLDDHVKHVASTKKLAATSPELSDALIKGARKVALRVLPVLVKQARLGGLYFDCKPANTLFVEGANVYLSDFDAAMYAVMRSEESCWEAHLLVSLLLMGTHIRCFQNKGIADGWAIAMRQLMLDLCVSARSAKWLYAARITECSFVPGRITTPADAQSRLEMMVYAYFCDPSRTTQLKTNPRFGSTFFSKSLVNQLLKFVLTGSCVSRDPSVCAALGEE